MKLKSLLLMMLVFFLTIHACKEVEDPTPIGPINEKPDPDLSNFPTVDIQVVIPEGTNVDLSGAFVVANSFEYSMDAGNKSKVAVLPGEYQLAFLLDAQDRVLLSGFIGPGKQEISTMSTAEVLFFFGTGASALSPAFRKRYMEEAGNLPALSKFKDKITGLFKEDPIAMAEGGFSPVLETALEEFYKATSLIDIMARQINFNPTGGQSGVQVFDNDFQSVFLRNHYRRRAHAFIYKKSFKDKEGNETILKRTYSSGDQASSEQGIEPTASVSGFLGTLADGLAGQGMKYAVKDTPPISIPLSESESQAKFDVRVVGASTASVMWENHTDTEREKWESLMIETLILDIVIPVISEAFSAAKDGATSEEGKLLADVIKNTADLSPMVIALFETRDLNQFVKEFLSYLLTDKGNAFLQEQLAGYLAKKALPPDNLENFDLDRKYKEEVKKARFLKLLQYVDLAIKGADFTKMIGEITVSSPLESFEVTALEHDIKLVPSEASVMVFTNKELTVETKTELSDGQAFLYKWSTSGTYGDIRDNLGNSGIEFENGQKTITYRSQTAAGNLPDDAEELITVEAFVKQGTALTRLGIATAKLTIKKAQLEIKPSGIVLSGKQKIQLYLSWANGAAFHQPNEFDYRYEWATTGAYGVLTGGTGSVTTTEPSITYTALDEEVEKGVETITVKPYRKSKGSDEWVSFDRVEGTINIENDENKIILYVPISVISWGPTESGVYTNCGAGTIFYIDPVENAISYSARVIHFSPEVIPRVTGTSRTWSASTPGLLNENGQYEFAYILAAAGSSPTWIGPPDCGGFIASASNRKGMAQVIVTLKPN